MNTEEMRQLELLLIALVDTRLTDEDRAQLRELLQRSPEARSYFARFMFVHGALAWRNVPAPASLTTPGPTIAVDDAPLPIVAPAKLAATVAGRRVTLTSLGGAALIMSLVVTAMAFMVPPAYRAIQRSWQPDAPPPIVAQLTRVDKAEWGHGQIGTLEGSHLVIGQRVELRSGLVEVTYRTGARIVVEGPASLIISGGNSSQLQQGKLVATVPRAALGYTVNTPLARFIDLGTEFAVATRADGTAEMHVFAGSVQAEALGDDGTWSNLQTLTANQSVQIDPQNRALVPVDGVKPKFVREIILPPFELGSALGNYGFVDSAEGVTLIYGGVARRSGSAETFEFFSTQKNLWVTPLLFAYDGAAKQYRITGIGKSIESDGTGKQSAPFVVVAGSDQFTTGVHTFGMFDGRVERNRQDDVTTLAINTGVVAQQESPAGAWKFSHRESPRQIHLGRTYSLTPGADERLGQNRIYAARLIVKPPSSNSPPE